MSKEPPKELDEKLASLIAESRILEGAVAEIQARIGMIDSVARENRVSEMTMAGLEAAKKGDEIFVPIGGGSYLKAVIADTEKIIAGIGAGVAVEKTLLEAKGDIGGRMEELRKARSTLEGQFAQALKRMQTIKEEIEQLTAKMKT